MTAAMKKWTAAGLVMLLLTTILALFAPIHAEAAVTPKLNKTSITLCVGKTYTLKVTNSKAKTTWSSSKKSVATVSSKGKVTAKKSGTAYITAKVGSKKIKCKIVVKSHALVNKSSGTNGRYVKQLVGFKKEVDQFYCRCGLWFDASEYEAFKYHNDEECGCGWVVTYKSVPIYEKVWMEDTVYYRQCTRCKSKYPLM